MDKEKKIKERVYNELVLPHKLVYSPFKTFEKIKEKKIGNFYMPSIFFLLVAVLNIIQYQYTGFVLNFNNPSALNSFLILITTLIPFVIFIFANLSITTFLDGKGTLEEIYKVTGYSLYPYLLLKGLAIILTNFITAEGKVFVKTVYILGIVISLLLLFVGFVVVHEYGVMKNIFSFVLTFIAMCVIIFLVLLILNLLQKLVGFSESFINEIIYRIRGR